MWQTSCFTRALNSSWQIMTRALPSQIRRSCRYRSCEIHLLSQARWTSDKLPEFQILKQNGISSFKIYFFPSVLWSEELEVFHNCFESFVNVERFEEFWYKWFVQKYKEGSDDENRKGHVEDSSWQLGVTFPSDKVSLEPGVWLGRVMGIANIFIEDILWAVRAVQRIA